MLGNYFDCLKRVLFWLWTIFCLGGIFYSIVLAAANAGTIMALYYFALMMAFAALGTTVWAVAVPAHVGERVSSFMDGSRHFLRKKPPILSPYRAALQDGDAMGVIEELLRDVYPEFPDSSAVNLLLTEAYIACGFPEYAHNVMDVFFARSGHQKDEDSLSMLMLYAETAEQSKQRTAVKALLQQECQAGCYGNNQRRRMKEKYDSLVE